MAGTSRHFAHRHPTFGGTLAGKLKEAYKKSPYYLWWEFLRRHEGYKQTCENGGEGDFAALYADFGDVHATDFKTWWRTGDRGATLFAEPRAVDVEIVRTAEDFPSGDEYLVVSLPLALPKAHLTNRVNALLKKLHPGKRGVQVRRRSRARFPIIGQPNMDALETALALYDERSKYPHKTLWQLGSDSGQFPSKQRVSAAEEKQGDKARDKKRYLTNQTRRHLKRAEAVIYAVGEGRFPNKAGME